MMSPRGAFLERENVADQKDQREQKKIALAPTVAPGGKLECSQGSIIVASVAKIFLFGGTIRRT